LNINCLPSKNEIWSAKVADLVHHAANFGAMTGSVATDMAKVRQRKRDMVEGMIPMTLQQYNASGAELIMGVSKEARAFRLTPWSQIRGRFHRRYGNNFR
jgi:pyruvate/2-oxoglutarate dehydrogenase complex dihydrolipoamide dehydrogenase (E3) component